MALLLLINHEPQAAILLHHLFCCPITETVPIRASFHSEASAPGVPLHSFDAALAEARDWLKSPPKDEPHEQTLNAIMQNPREGLIFRFISMTTLQFTEFRGWHNLRFELNRQTIEQEGTHERNVEYEIMTVRDLCDDLNQQHLDIQDRLSKTKANLNVLLARKEAAAQEVETVCLDIEVPSSDGTDHNIAPYPTLVPINLETILEARLEAELKRRHESQG